MGIKTLPKPGAVAATRTLMFVRKFIQQATLSHKKISIPAIIKLADDPRLLKLRISNQVLRGIAGNGGFPDWPEEGVEEKKTNDWLRPPQIARAVLEYRAGKSYRVSERLSRLHSRMFPTVWDFIASRLRYFTPRSERVFEERAKLPTGSPEWWANFRKGVAKRDAKRY